MILTRLQALRRRATPRRRRETADPGFLQSPGSATIRSALRPGKGAASGLSSMEGSFGTGVTPRPRPLAIDTVPNEALLTRLFGPELAWCPMCSTATGQRINKPACPIHTHHN